MCLSFSIGFIFLLLSKVYHPLLKSSLTNPDPSSKIFTENNEPIRCFSPLEMKFSLFTLHNYRVNLNIFLNSKGTLYFFFHGALIRIRIRILSGSGYTRPVGRIRIERIQIQDYVILR
jgi:hypothetical protein